MNMLTSRISRNVGSAGKMAAASTLFLSVAFASVSAVAAALEPDAIAEAVGVKATTSPDGVVRVTWSREDVAFRVDGYRLKPFAGLTSWAAFKETETGAMVMGDTVVFEDEAGPAMDAAFASGLAVTALHNHFFFDEPPVYFMHIGGEGDPTTLADGVRAIWDAIRDVRATHPVPMRRFPGPPPEAGRVSPEALQRILGLDVNSDNGIVKFSVGEVAEMNGVEVGASMGLTTWMAFSGNDESAVVDGDFIMEGDEVQTVLRALRDGGIHIVALHNHMIGETPAYYFAHFWGKGDPANLARALRSALDAQKN